MCADTDLTSEAYPIPQSLNLYGDFEFIIWMSMLLNHTLCMST